MNLYLISQSVNNDYDTYDRAIVIASNPEEARYIFPPDSSVKWDAEKQKWQTEYFSDMNAWTNPKDVEVEYIGFTHISDRVIVLSSFRAG